VEYLYVLNILRLTNERNVMGRARLAGFTEEIHRGFWRGNLSGLALFEGLGVVWRIMLKWFIKKWNEDWIVFIWLTTGTRGKLL